MTEGRDLPAVDLFLRQGLIGGKRVPVIWSSGIHFELLKNLHELADADIGEFGQATDLLPEVQSQDQAATIPWAARYMKCSDDVRDLCKEEPKYCTQCWVDRDDGIIPETQQASNPKGQTSWHPGWRSHQLVGRNLAMGVLFSLQSAINIWTDHVTGEFSKHCFIPYMYRNPISIAYNCHGSWAAPCRRILACYQLL